MNQSNYSAPVKVGLIRYDIEVKIRQHLNKTESRAIH